MQHSEAFNRLKDLPPDQLMKVLLDQTADEVLRSVAALRLASSRDLPAETRVQWLKEGWDASTLEIKKYILEALGNCLSSEAIPFVKARLSDPEFQMTALTSLAQLKDLSILPVCTHFIRSGTEGEFVTAIGALRQLGSPDAISLMELALQSGPTPRARRFAAQALALLGVPSGERLLESELFRLQSLMTESKNSDDDNRRAIIHEYARIVVCLTYITNKNALLALKAAINQPATDKRLLEQLKVLTVQMLGLDSMSALDEWKHSMERWIDARLGTCDEHRWIST